MEDEFKVELGEPGVALGDAALVGLVLRVQFGERRKLVVGPQ